MIRPDLLAVATHTGEAVTTGVVAVLFAMLAWLGFHRRQRSVGWFWVVFTVLALALTAVAAAGHVFSGW